MGVPPSLPCTMLDMSRTSLEYVCKHVSSPNIARRFGHKLDEDTAAQAVAAQVPATTYQYQLPGEHTLTYQPGCTVTTTSQGAAMGTWLGAGAAAWRQTPSTRSATPAL